MHKKRKPISPNQVVVQITKGYVMFKLAEYVIVMTIHLFSVIIIIMFIVKPIAKSCVKSNK
mgnify:CR=1 FL=1